MVLRKLFSKKSSNSSSHHNKNHSDETSTTSSSHQFLSNIIDLLFQSVESQYKKSVMETFVIPDDLLREIFGFIENDEETCLSFQLTCWNWYLVSCSYRYQEFEIPNYGKYTFYQGAKNCYYLILPSPTNNYSTYTVPRRKPWSWNDADIITRWYRLRINPETLMIHTGDHTFSKSTGVCNHHTWKTREVSYATCFGCEGGSVDDGRAMCDLSGTPFKFSVSFLHNGYCSYGTWNFSKDDQIISLTGGGYCGWTCPVGAADEKQAVDGGWFIKLEVISNK